MSDRGLVVRMASACGMASRSHERQDLDEKPPPTPDLDSATAAQTRGCGGAPFWAVDVNNPCIKKNTQPPQRARTRARAFDP